MGGPSCGAALFRRGRLIHVELRPTHRKTQSGFSNKARRRFLAGLILKLFGRGRVFFLVAPDQVIAWDVIDESVETAK